MLFRSAMFPEFATSEESFVTLWLDTYKAKTSEKVFKECYELAVYYQLGHKLATQKVLAANEGVEKGVVSSESIGDVSVSYSQPSTGTAESGNYVTTSYGREYLNLRKSKIIRATAVGVR